MTDQNYTQPQKVDPIDQAFPVHVCGTLLPDWDNIPEEFRNGWAGGNPWCKLVEEIFYHGGYLPKPREGVNTEHMYGHIRAVVGSFEPKHEHKIAGAGYLLSLWCDEPVSRNTGEA